MQAAVFDMDGTLVDTEPLHREAWLSTLAEIGVRIDEAEYAATFSGRPGREIARDRLGLTELEATAFAARVMDRFWEIAADRLRPLPGLEALLERLANWPLAVATSARREDAHRMLAELGLAGRFRAVVTIEDVTRGKPDPEPFLLAAERIRVRPEACLAFEDSANGLKAATAAGMFCIAIGQSGGDGIAHLDLPGYDDPRLAEFLARAIAVCDVVVRDVDMPKGTLH
jgi:beta-phosphoglucomutase family hydrolase